MSKRRDYVETAAVGYTGCMLVFTLLYLIAIVVGIIVAIAAFVKWAF